MTGKRLPVIELYSEAYSDSPLFQGCLIDYYISMIGFWSKAVKFYERKRCFAFWRSIWSSYQIDFNDLDENMKGNYSHIEQCTKALHELETKTQHKGIQGMASSVFNNFSDEEQLLLAAPTTTSLGVSLNGLRLMVTISTTSNKT